MVVILDSSRMILDSSVMIHESCACFLNQAFLFLESSSCFRFFTLIPESLVFVSAFYFLNQVELIQETRLDSRINGLNCYRGFLSGEEPTSCSSASGKSGHGPPWSTMYN